MNYISIKSIKTSLLMVLAIFVISSCEDESKAPIVTFDTAGHGAYPRLVSETGERNVDLFDIPSSRYTYTIEFVDDEKGALVTEYFLELEYVDINGVNSKAPFEFKRFSAAEFETNADGFKGISDIAIIATELISASGITNAQLNSSDVFRLTGTVITKSGQVFKGSNASASVQGASFRGHFDFSLPAVCPSDLAGTHTYSTIGWCGSGPTTGSVTWVTESAGVYSIVDGKYDMGAYDACYGDGTVGSGAAYPEGNLRIQDICNTLSWVGASQWGEIYTFNSVTVNGAVLTLDWVNDYGEAGVSSITREGGANWPALTK